MEEIIAPIDKKLLKAELTEDRLFRVSNKAGNQLYIIDNSNAPNVMLEIGRLREIAFRSRNGGSGKSVDLDQFDLDPAYHCKQIIVWDPDAEVIMGGYRFALGDEVLYDRFGQPVIPSSEHFTFSKKFLRNEFLRTIELSRSFVSLEYQNIQSNPKSLYALDNLFDGVMSMMALFQGKMEFFFGRVAISSSYPEEGRDIILYFMEKHFGGIRSRGFARRKIPVRVQEPRKWKKVFTEDDFAGDFKILKAELQKRGVNLPPLVNTYMKLAPSMKFAGAIVDVNFSNDIECGLLVRMDDIYPEKRERHTSKVDFKQLRARLKRLLTRHI